MLEFKEDMRKFRSISKIKQKQVENTFPDLLNVYGDENTNAYLKAAICVFDHWLTKEEAIAEIQDISEQKESMHNKKIHEFCVAITKLAECYLVKRCGKNKDRVSFREFTSEDGLIKSLTPSHHMVSDRHRFVLVFPKLNMIYFEGGDFTHHLYFKNIKDIVEIKNVAHNKGLYYIQ
jgi:hypothetical protein